MNTNTSIPWRERALITLPNASAVGGISISRLYEFEKEGRLRFRRLGGRTLLEVRTLVELIDSLPQWTPQTERTEAAVAARSARAKQQWRAPTIAEEAPPTLRMRGMRVKHSRMLPSLFGTSTADTERLGTTAMAEPSHDAPTPNGHDAAGVAGGTTGRIEGFCAGNDDRKVVELAARR